MKICWKYNNGKNGFCLNLPGYGGPGAIPVPHHRPAAEDRQEEGVYPELLSDASIVDAMHSAVKSVSDKGVREALENGIQSALQALQKRGGKDLFSITLEDEASKAA
jgi:hypothetical protein